MKIVLSDPKSGRSISMELPAERSAQLLNMKLAEVLDGNIVGLAGYKLKITGGSDKSGFPMDPSIDGPRKTRALRKISTTGRKRGMQGRFSVRGNIISADIEQVNAIVVEYGEKSADEVFPQKEKATKPAAAEAPKDAK